MLSLQTKKKKMLCPSQGLSSPEALLSGQACLWGRGWTPGQELAVWGCCWALKNTSSLALKTMWGTSVMVQQLRTHMPMQQTWVRSLVREAHMPWGKKAHVLQLLSLCSIKRDSIIMRNLWTAKKNRPCSLQLKQSPHAAKVSAQPK